MATAWFGVVDKSGALMSVASRVADELPAGWAVIPLEGRPEFVDVQWDALARDFVPRPAEPDAPTLVETIMDMASIKALTAQQRTAVQDALDAALGDAKRAEGL